MHSKKIIWQWNCVTIRPLYNVTAWIALKNIQTNESRLQVMHPEYPSDAKQQMTLHNTSDITQQHEYSSNTEQEGK